MENNDFKMRVTVPRANATTTPTGIAKQAKDVASGVADQAKDLAASQMRHQQEKSAGDLDDVAKALRQTSQQLQGNAVSPYVEKAADQVEKVSRFLRTTNVKELQRTIETFARREPLLFLGGAFAIGIVGARFLKSSEKHARISAEETPTQPDGFKEQPQAPRPGQTGPKTPGTEDF